MSAVRFVALAYGVAAYLGFLVVFAGLVDFLANGGRVGGIDARPAPLATALAVDLGLIALFGVSHSVMARAAFKRRWTRLVPEPIERSTYVLTTTLVFVLLIWQWRAIPEPVWVVHQPVARAALWGLSALGIALVVLSTFLTDHFDLFGLRQVWRHARGLAATPVPFRERWLYRHVRHPMMTGVLIWFWATPSMSVGRLVFAAGMTVYVAIGVALEERDLARRLGAAYADYRARVGAFAPRLGRRRR